MHPRRNLHVGVGFSHGITVGLGDGGHGLNGLGVRRTIHHGIRDVRFCGLSLGNGVRQWLQSQNSGNRQCITVVWFHIIRSWL